MKLIDEDISDEGEIFSDDEEAAYYPKIVKSRENAAKARSSGKSSSAKPTTTEDDSSGNSSSGPFDHDSGHKDYSSENQDSLDQDRGSRQSSDGSKCSPSSSSRDSRGRHRGRWSKQELGGWNDSSGGGHRGKSGGAQPHHRQHRQHEGRSGGGGSVHNIPARHMSPYQLACVSAAVRDRRDRGESLLVTPRGNTCNNLDQFNYPAPPSWYLEALEAYDREKEKEQEVKSVGEPAPTIEDKGGLEVVLTDSCLDRPELPCVEPEVKVDSEPRGSVLTLEAPKASRVGEGTRSPKDVVALSIGNGEESEDDYDRYLDQLDEEEDEIEDLTPDIGSVVTSLNEEFPQLNPLPEQPQTLSKLAGVFPEEESLRLLLKLDAGDEENGPVQGDTQPSKPGTL